MRIIVVKTLIYLPQSLRPFITPLRFYGKIQYTKQYGIRHSAYMMQFYTPPRNLRSSRYQRIATISQRDSSEFIEINRNQRCNTLVF